jgi:hypothetical protein
VRARVVRQRAVVPVDGKGKHIYKETFF